MKAVITADIIESSKLASKDWVLLLKQHLEKHGKQGRDWEIYRGDELQLLLEDPSEAFFAAVRIKAELRKSAMDARISIGLGDVDFKGINVKESNGTAFLHSGRNLEEMKKNRSQNLSVKSDDEAFDENFNLIFLLLETVFEKWTVSAANSVLYYLENHHLNQIDIANELGISQGALSRALKRANAESILETDRYFRKKIQQLQ